MKIQLLAYTAAAGQEDYLYHVDGIDSNDRLYGPDPEFRQELDNIGATCLTELLAALDHLKMNKQNALAVKLAHELLDIVLAHGDLIKCQPSLRLLIGFLKAYDPKCLPGLQQFAQHRLTTEAAAQWSSLVDLL